MIVALSGKKGVGKNYIGNMLIDWEGFTEIKFADPLKRICAKASGLPSDVFESNDLKDKLLETPITLTIDLLNKIYEESSELGIHLTQTHKNAFEAAGLNKVFDTSRKMLQFTGSDLFRNIYDTNVFVNHLLNKFTDGDFVITDCRFENEREAVRSRGGLNFLIQRPELTDKVLDLHKSENDLGDPDWYDLIVVNATGKYMSLKSEISLWLKWVGQDRVRQHRRNSLKKGVVFGKI